MLTFSILSVCLTKNVKAGTGDVPVLAISLLNQDPNPVEPGNFFKLRFKIENSGYAEAKNVQFEILPEFPISIYQDSTTKNITSISPAQLANEAVNIDFNLKVDSNALPGEHQLNIKYKVEGGYWTKIDPITISVKQHDVIVSLNSVNFTPQIAKPGDELSLKLNLQNLADTQVRYLTIKLGLVSVITTSTSVTKTELPFSPVSSTDTAFPAPPSGLTHPAALRAAQPAADALPVPASPASGRTGRPVDSVRHCSAPACAVVSSRP